MDGVTGCGVWVSKPQFNSEKGWSAEHQPFDCLKAGKSILRHKDIERIDNEIMRFFINDIDLSIPREKRFDMVRDLRMSKISLERSEFVTEYEVMPVEWANMLVRVGDSNLTEAVWAQRQFDPEIPF